LQNILSCTKIEVNRMIVLHPNKPIPTVMLPEQYRGRQQQTNSCWSVSRNENVTVFGDNRNMILVA
jgi:hypothetical protein